MGTTCFTFFITSSWQNDNLALESWTSYEATIMHFLYRHCFLTRHGYRHFFLFQNSSRYIVMKSLQSLQNFYMMQCRSSKLKFALVHIKWFSDRNIICSTKIYLYGLPYSLSLWYILKLDCVEIISGLLRAQELNDCSHYLPLIRVQNA